MTKITTITAIAVLSSTLLFTGYTPEEQPLGQEQPLLFLRITIRVIIISPTTTMAEDTTTGDTTVTGIIITTDTDTMADTTTITDIDTMAEIATVLLMDNMDIIEMPTITISTEEDIRTIPSAQRCALYHHITRTV